MSNGEDHELARVQRRRTRGNRRGEDGLSKDATGRTKGTALEGLPGLEVKDGGQHGRRGGSMGGKAPRGTGNTSEVADEHDGVAWDSFSG